MNQCRKASLTRLLSLSTLAVTFGCGARPNEKIAIELPALHAPSRLAITSTTFSAGQAISRIYSSYGSNGEPDIHWPQSPEAKSYALIVEDPDAPGSEPFVHWAVFNLPASTTATIGYVTKENLDATSRGVAGKNSTGAVGYYGPHPPIGDEPHHYHFEVFALDRVLGLPAGADRNALVSAMSGHVVASGELIGTYQER